jgi:hypothetical protein
VPDNLKGLGVGRIRVITLAPHAFGIAGQAFWREHHKNTNQRIAR